MDPIEKKAQVIQLLEELGVRAAAESSADGEHGFPLLLELASGSSIRIELAKPAPFDCLDEQQIGAAVVDPFGTVLQSWGLAKRLTMLRKGKSVLGTALSGIPECVVSGHTYAEFWSGHRIFAAPLSRNHEGADGGAGSNVLVLVTDAGEEQSLRMSAERTEGHARVLRRLGKALAVEEGALKVAITAAHEIASCTDLTAVLIWVLDESSGTLKLASSVGVNRAGQKAAAELGRTEAITCLAELCAASGKEAAYEDVTTQAMSAELEGKFCYLRPGGLFLFPLATSERTVGILEIIGKYDDPSFLGQRELFAALAEQLTLSINAALMYEAAERRASHDALTGLANHRTIHEFLSSRLAEARRLDRQLGVIMIDVDHFRAFNEEEGHDAGDAVLRQVADAIRSCLRPYDLAARYGGEEFTVVVPNSGPDYVAAVAERIRAKIESKAFLTAGGQERVVTASLGAAVFPDNQTEAPELMKAADAALYRSKQAGRNRVTMWEGVFESSQHRPKATIDLTKWLDPQLTEVTDALCRQTVPEIDFLVRRMGLSEGQRLILTNLIRIAPTYEHWLTSGMDEDLAAFESDAQTRSMLPSLHALNERFDGLGPRRLQGKQIPLLARIVQVLTALGEDRGKALLADPAKFDPEIVMLLADLSSAA